MGETARMVFTDPPYNVPVNGHVRSGNGGAHREFAMASGEMSDTEFRAFLMSCLALWSRRLPKGGIAMICMDWRHIEPLIAVGKAAGLELINLCVWNKTNGGMGSLYRSKHELVCLSSANPARPTSTTWSSASTAGTATTSGTTPASTASGRAGRPTSPTTRR
jgi:DNA modification methylase